MTPSRLAARKASRWWLAVAGLGLALATALVVLGGNGFLKVRQMKREAETLTREIQRLETENDRLARTIDRLRGDPSLIEKIAREELGLVKDRERVLKFPPMPPGQKADGPPGAR